MITCSYLSADRNGIGCFCGVGLRTLNICAWITGHLQGEWFYSLRLTASQEQVEAVHSQQRCMI